MELGSKRKKNEACERLTSCLEQQVPLEILSCGFPPTRQWFVKFSIEDVRLPVRLKEKISRIFKVKAHHAHHFDSYMYSCNLLTFAGEYWNVSWEKISALFGQHARFSLWSFLTIISIQRPRLNDLLRSLFCLLDTNFAAVCNSEQFWA